MMPKTKPNIETFILKFLFVALCCALSATFAANLREMTRQQIPFVMSMSLSLTLLAILLFVAGRLGIHGKPSESWAFLAYGSWMTIPGLALLHTVFLHRHMAQLDWALLSVATCLFAFFAWGGIRSSLHNEWSKVLVWWFASAPPLLIFLLLWGFRIKSWFDP